MHSTMKIAAMAAALAFVIPAAAAADANPAQPAAQSAPKAKSAGNGKAKKAETKKAKANRKTAPRRLVDINRAGKADLQKLPGVDAATAEKIVAGRPYRSKADLVTHKIISMGAYEQLRREVVAKPK